MTSSRDTLHPLALRQESLVSQSGPGPQENSAMAARLGEAAQELDDAVAVDGERLLKLYAETMAAKHG